MSTEPVETAPVAPTPTEPVAAVAPVEPVTPKVEAAAPTDKGPDPVPYSRFQEVNEAKKGRRCSP